MVDGSRRRAVIAAVVSVIGIVLVGGLVGTVVLMRQDEDVTKAAAWRTPTPVPAAPALSPIRARATPDPDAPTPDRVSQAIAGALDDPALGSGVGVAVLDERGEPLFQSNADTAVTPASTLKVLTAAGALYHLGTQTRFNTSVVEGSSTTSPSGPTEIVLVGGGDPSLTSKSGSNGPAAPASLATLAESTAAALKTQQHTTVRLAVDDSLYTGPTEHPSWPSSYVSGGYVAPVTALSVDNGRVDPDEPTREPDPSLAAGERFAELLAEEGIKVRPGVRRDTAPEAAHRIASVASPPVANLVETMLARSDNDIAEHLLRHAAVAADEPASFAGGARAVTNALFDLKVDVNRLAILDGSGLSRSNEVSPQVVAKVLTAAASDERPRLRSILTGLSVAGFSGTLDERFGADESRAGAGVVRAKTGTLTGVSSLAGMVQTRERHLLLFAVLAGQSPDPVGAEAALDRVAAALAGCGCSAEPGSASPTKSPAPPD